jgi:hypothetical protein
MMPARPPLFHFDKSEALRAMAEDIQRARNLCNAIGDVVYALLQCSPIADSKRKAVSDTLAVAAMACLCRSTEDQMERLKAAPEQDGGPSPYDLEMGMLTHLISTRDTLTAQLEQIEKTKESFGENKLAGPMANYIETMAIPIRAELEQVEQRISSTQRQMEADQK